MPEDPEIPRLVTRITAAVESHDARAFADLFAQDADFTTVAGLTVHGREAIERLYVPLFDGPFRNLRFKAGLVTVRRLTDDLTSVDISWTMSGIPNRTGAERPARRGLINWIVGRDPGGWQILMMHSSEFPPPSLTIGERVRRGAQSGLRVVRARSSPDRSEGV
jgi:uncharacterized protein (TIGR02246 family)